MKLRDLLSQLGIEDANENEREYNVIVDMPMGVQEAEYTIKGVRWDHQSHEVVLEIEDD